MEHIEQGNEGGGDVSATSDRDVSGSGQGNGVGGALTREALVARAKSYRANPTIERVPLPWLGYNEHAFVRGMTAGERDDFEGSLVERQPDGENRVSAKNIRAKFLVRTICGAEGVRYFADHEEGLLSGLDAKTADALYEKARSLSGLTDADIKDMAKNSERARSAPSSINSDSKSSDASRTS